MAGYMVTGGAGFIGSHIVEELVRRRAEVRVIDNFSTGKRVNIRHLEDRVQVHAIDLACEPDIEKLLDGVECVIHQAAVPSVPKSIDDPIGTHDANVNGTLRLLVASRRAGIRRLVYASSSSIYGDTPTSPKHEDAVARPLSPYGAQKYAAEVYCQVFSRSYGLETVSLRYFNVFGPRQDASSPYSGVLAQFITALLDGKRPTIHGDGLQARDFTYVSNVVEANLLACEIPEVSGEVFNVACGDRISINSLLASIQEIIGSDIAPLRSESRAGDIRFSQADIQKAETRLGYRPGVDFKEGLRRTIEWYKGNLGSG